MITLTPDQEQVRSDLRTALRTNQSVLVYAPPGFGKTVLAAALTQSIVSKNKRVLFDVHRRALLQQTAVTYDNFDIAYSYIAAGLHHNVYRHVNVASIDTLKNRLGKHPADYMFVDEAHLSAADGWEETVLHYKRNGCKIIGLTGSPVRLDGKPLGKIWDTMVLGPSPRWLIDNGRLSTYRAFSPAGFDGTEKSVLANAVSHWRSKASGQRTIGFAPTVARAYDLAEEFRANGIRAVALDATTPHLDRNRAFNALADNDLDIIFNKSLFCEGFDLSAQVGRDVTIECVLDLDRTNSLARHLQKIMRCMRRKPTPGTILDMVGALRRDDLGLPDWDREWSLEGETNGRVTSKQEEFIKLCPMCGASHDPAPKCTVCGHVYEIKARKIAEVEGELEEIDVAAVRAAAKASHDATARSLADKIAAGNIDDPKLAKEVEYLMNSVVGKRSKSPAKWAAHVLTARLAKRQGVSV